MELKIKNIVYSNSDYFDVLEIFLDEQKKYNINVDDIIIFSDKQYLNYNCIIYDNNQSYAERLIYCLSNIKDEIILYQHEDMFLYSHPNINKLNNYLNFLQENKYSFIRLCRTGSCILNKTSINSLFEIDKSSNDFFAVQPTLWKVKDFIKFLSNSKDSSIWELELKSSKIAHASNIDGLMHFNNEPPRGGHFDSYVWPYIATAIVKGKWNFIQYSNELNKISKVIKSNRQKL
jgi:hypothetical protein